MPAQPPQSPGEEQADWPAGDQPLTRAEIAELDRDLDPADYAPDPADYDLEDLDPDCGPPAGPEGRLASPVLERCLPVWGEPVPEVLAAGFVHSDPAGHGPGFRAGG